jgi:3'(2'), 5'-bisphosphate nucleotidase
VLRKGMLESLLDLCRLAGAEILAHYHDENRGALLREKADSSPLTEADVASHRIIVEGLARISPGIPVLSEESSSEDIAARFEWDQLWMVDPLDGTREFLDRSGQFTINIALIEQQRAVEGIIYHPLSGVAWAGVVGDAAWRFEYVEGRWRQQTLRTRALGGESMVLFASRRHRNDKLAQCLAFLEQRAKLERRNSGSALKFCDLACGDGDFYPRFSPCSEWDVAAGDAIVTAAGGCVLGMDGAPLRYNARESLLSPHFLAVGDRDAQLWPELLRHIN